VAGTAKNTGVTSLFRAGAIIMSLVSLAVAIVGLNDSFSFFQTSQVRGNAEILFSIALGLLGTNLAVLSRR